MSSSTVSTVGEEKNTEPKTLSQYKLKHQSSLNVLRKIAKNEDEKKNEEPSMSCRGTCNGISRVVLGYFFFLAVIMGFCFAMSIVIQISFLTAKATRHNEYTVYQYGWGIFVRYRTYSTCSCCWFNIQTSRQVCFMSLLFISYTISSSLHPFFSRSFISFFARRVRSSCF